MAVDAVVVGSGPNGLAAALVLAKAGLEVEVHEAAATIGGGARTAELTEPGFRHDVCSAAHPMALASPFFRAFDLAAHGVEMLQPQVAYAHPLDGARAGLAWRDLGRTVDELGADGPAWRSLLGPLAMGWEGLARIGLSDFRHVPLDLATMARLGLRVLGNGPPLRLARFQGEIAPAMLAGVSAHAIIPARSPAAAGTGLFLAAMAHAVGWPLARGGSQAITDAVAAEFRRHGGRIITGHRVQKLAELPRCRAALLNVAPVGALQILGDDLPGGYARWLRAYRYGNAVCKVDFALAGPVPWAAPECGQAGTLHLAGTRDEALAAGRAVAAGHHPPRPYVLVVQPGIVDPTRAPDGKQTLWTYAHVPAGSQKDVSAAVSAQIDRFAPGFRDLIIGAHVITAADAQRHNPNNVGGDIAAGALSAWQLLMRPLPKWDPYATPLPGTYLCSASTPPGPGVHGMAGVHAARRVLRQRFGIYADPLDLIAGKAARA